MKNDVLYMTIQPCTEKAFWIANIKHGIFDMAKDLQCVPCILNLEDSHNLPKLNNTPVLVVGNDDDWLDRILGLIAGLGARGIVVNGSMQDSEFHTCSGVVFELEKAIRYSLGQLQATGRKKTAFLGANPRSVSTSVADKRQRQADNRHNAQTHANIDHDLEQKHTCDAAANHTVHIVAGFDTNINAADNNSRQKQQRNDAAKHAKLFSNCRKNE